MGETEGNIVGMIALALALLLNTNLNDPPGVHTLRIIVSGSAGFIFGRPELALHPHEGSTAINPDRLMHAYHGKTDVNLLPGVYDICAFSEAYRPSCVVIKMPDHNAHITVTLTAMPNLTGVPEAEADSRQ